MATIICETCDIYYLGELQKGCGTVHKGCKVIKTEIGEEIVFPTKSCRIMRME